MAAIAESTNGHAHRSAGANPVKNSQEEVKLPLLEDVMQLARIGDVPAMKVLLAKGTFNAAHKDHEGITPLHWAAINNQYAMCKYLLDEGADVNAKGGEAVASPAMWAAQRAHYYVVNLLLQRGADPLLTDAQGYNILHLATFEGNLFLLTLLLHQDIPVDSPDLQGHTCLMWAAYKGYPMVVDIFLRWGASVHARDDQGFAPLHWALVKGSQPCISKLVEYGADRFAETNDGKTPQTVAKEMKSQRMWVRALGEHGFDIHGNPKPFPLPYLSFLVKPANFPKVYFILPFFSLYICLYFLSSFAIYFAIPLTALYVYGNQWVASRLLEWGPSTMQHMQRTPSMAGVFAASLFWVGIQWLLVTGRHTWRAHFILNTFFGVAFVACSWFYYLCITGDPGYVPKAGSRSSQKAVIDELLGLWKYDDQNFCMHCMIRTPLRSKHCRKCRRCVAKLDHHCPWIFNCVGANNLRHFYMYILSLGIGILLFIRLAMLYLDGLPAPESRECRVLSESICGVILRDPFTVMLSIWATLQLTWVSMLLFVQSIQISRAVTTYEAMKGHQGHGHGAGEVATALVTAGATTMDGAQLPPAANNAGHHKKSEGWFAQWKKLLGLDTFVATAQSAKSGGGRGGNPFSRGVVTNCRDFWCDPAPILSTRETGAAMLDGQVVNYTRMYETPPRMKASRGGDMYQELEVDDSMV